MKITREMIEDIKNLQSFDMVARLEQVLVDELRKSGIPERHIWERLTTELDTPQKSKGIQIFNENDPYGEELWEE